MPRDHFRISEYVRMRKIQDEGVHMNEITIVTVTTRASREHGI